MKSELLVVKMTTIQRDYAAFMSVVSLPPFKFCYIYQAVFKCKLGIIIGNNTHLKDVISYPMASISLNFRPVQGYFGEYCPGLGGSLNFPPVQG